MKPVKDSGAKKALDSVLNFLGLGSLVGESPLDKISGAVDELMDSATGKDTSAAFDITFLYNGEEVQPAVDPATGAAYEVQVTFTPAADSTLAGADALQVYHITNGETGLNEDAVKAAATDNVKAEPVEATVSENGAVTVAATDFSIYVVTDRTAPSPYSITVGQELELASDYNRYYTTNHSWSSSDDDIVSVSGWGVPRR